MSNLDYYFINDKKISDIVARARPTTPDGLKVRLSDLGYHGPNAEVYLINPYRDLEKSDNKGDPNVAAWGRPYSPYLQYYYSKISKENKLIFVDKKDAPYPILLENFRDSNRFCPFEYMAIIRGSDVDGPIEIWYSAEDDCCYYKENKYAENHRVNGRGMFVALQGAGGAGGAASRLDTPIGTYVKGGAGGGGGAFGIFYLNLSISSFHRFKVYIGKGGKGENGKPGGRGEPSEIADVADNVIAYCAGGEGGGYEKAEVNIGGGTPAEGGSGGMLPSPNSFPEVSLLVASAGGNGGDGGANKYSLWGIGSGLTTGANGEACPNRFDFSLPIDTSLSFSYSRWWNWIYNNKRLGSPIGKNNAAGRANGGQSCSGGGGGGGAFMCLSNASSDSFVENDVLKNTADGYGAGGAGGSAGFSHTDAGMDGYPGCFAILTPVFY